eukprot:SAG11_NODE_6447_length_1311_cov_1.396865_2_plen_134_part_00
MGCKPSTPQETALDRERHNGDFTSAGVVRISQFWRLFAVVIIEWEHPESGRVHTVKKYQSLAWGLTKLDLRDNKLKVRPSQRHQNPWSRWIGGGCRSVVTLRSAARHFPLHVYILCSTFHVRCAICGASWRST